ncbi:MAG TPA: hypothetical protein VII16_04495 [Actinomycetes bacterium]
MSQATTPAGGRLGRRRGYLIGAAAGAVLLLAAAGAAVALAPPSHQDLESVAKSVPAPAATQPLRIDRWGSNFCMVLPMCPEQANSNLLYDAGATLDEQYRWQWQAALQADGWTRQICHAYPETVWWTRHKVAVTPTLIGDGIYGPYFEWGTGDLVVSIRHVGTRSGELPGPTPGCDTPLGAADA